MAGLNVAFGRGLGVRFAIAPVEVEFPRCFFDEDLARSPLEKKFLSIVCCDRNY